MGKKTALFGGFLLLILLVAGIASGVMYYRAHQFQQSFQQWSGVSHVEFGHLRFGMGDLQQTENFPRSTGQFRLNVQNRCSGDLIDLGVVKYSMGHVPGLEEGGQLQWLPAGWEDEQPLLTWGWSRQGEQWQLALQASPWLQTIALHPQWLVERNANGWRMYVQADLIKLADITKTPDDFLARDVALEAKLSDIDSLDSGLTFSASQLSIGTNSLGKTELRLLPDSEEEGQMEWTLTGQSDALRWGDWLLTQTSLNGKLFVGDTAASNLIVASAVQSCGGFATAKSHEFNVQSAYNSLIQKGLSASMQFKGEVQGSPLAFSTQVRMNPQIDFNTGLIHLGRTIEIVHEQDIPFQKVGKKQRDQALATGLYGELELMGRHQQKWTRNALLLQTQLAQLGRSHSRAGDSLAAHWAEGLKTSLADWEQSLYLREFALAQQAEPTPRVNFEGLDGVRIDAQGGVRKLLQVP
ncbi:MAG TPA: hypothetical protein VFV43_01655 [Limnobacter sp.]|nr:hypothetical protein [Limnobacter sp.]